MPAQCKKQTHQQQGSVNQHRHARHFTPEQQVKGPAQAQAYKKNTKGVANSHDHCSCLGKHCSRKGAKGESDKAEMQATLIPTNLRQVARDIEQ
jgi:hypothetical protein